MGSWAYTVQPSRISSKNLCSIAMNVEAKRFGKTAKENFGMAPKFNVGSADVVDTAFLKSIVPAEI